MPECKAPDEIEITLEMARAGAREIERFDNRFESAEDAATRVFVAMLSVRVGVLNKRERASIGLQRSSLVLAMTDEPLEGDVTGYVELVRGVLVTVGKYPDRRIRDTSSGTDRVEYQQPAGLKE